MVLAPNVFHVGIEEKVSVTVTGVRHPVKVLLFVHDYPGRKTNFSHTEGLFKPGMCHNNNSIAIFLDVMTLCLHSLYILYELILQNVIIIKLL